MVLTATTTGFTQIAEMFDRFFVENYKLLQRKVNFLFQKQLKKDEQIEVVHNMYARVKKRILISGYTGSDFMPYCFFSLRNDMRHFEKRNKKKRDKEASSGRDIDVNDIDFEDFIDCQLLKKELEDISISVSTRETYFLTEKLFEYITTKHSYEDTVLFELYFLAQKKKQTYKKLAEATGIKFPTIKKRLTNLRNDVKLNFDSWVKEDLEEFRNN